MLTVQHALNALSTMFAYDFFQHAFIAGTVVGIAAGAVGYFVVLRGLSFAAHALSHVGFAGAAGAVVLALPAIDGLLAFTGAGAVAMGRLGERLRGRDVSIGIVLAWSLGLGVLFMSLYRGNATGAYALLFGEILGVSSASLAVTFAASLAALVALAVTYRPLLYASIDPDGAYVSGVAVRSVGVTFMLVLAVAVSAAAQVVGVLLIFTLLVAPAAIADRLTARPPLAMLLAVICALAFTWAGLVCAFYFPYPVSFFITSFAFGTYVIVRCARQRSLVLTKRRLIWQALRRRRNAETRASRSPF
jgi:zinc/manganese transport system permease protein